MAGLRFSDIQSRPTEVLDLTSLTLDEFHQLVTPFEAAFQEHMAVWRLDGKPRSARRYTTYSNSPLPTPEDRLLFILTYLKTYSLQVVHGRLFGMVQGKANQWIHVLLPVLLTTLRTLGDAPARSVADLARRLGLCEADISALLTTAEQETPPDALALDLSLADTDRPEAPLLPMTGLSVRSSVPRMRLNRRTIIAARKNAIRSRTCC